MGKVRVFGVARVLALSVLAVFAACTTTSLDDGTGATGGDGGGDGDAPALGLDATSPVTSYDGGDAFVGTDASSAETSTLDAADGALLDAEADADLHTDAGADSDADAGPDPDPNPERIVTDRIAPESIAVDAANLYFTDPGDGTVWQVDKATLASTQLASGQGKPWHIAVDDAYVYWSSTNDDAIMRVPIGGGVAPTVLYTTSKPTAVIVDGTMIYWYAVAPTVGLWRAAKDGSTTPVKLPVAGRCNNALEMTARAGRVYWWNVSLGTYCAGSFTPTTLVSKEELYDTHSDRGLGVYGPTSLFFGRMVLNKWSIVPGCAITGPVHYIATDRALATGPVWWSTKGATIAKCTAGQNAETVVTSAAVKANHLVVDDTSVYWTDTTFIGRAPR